MSEKKVYRIDLDANWGSSQKWARNCSLMEAINNAFGESESSSIKKVKLTPYEKGDHN